MSNETIADIIAEFRNKTGDMYDGSIMTDEYEFHSYADRIEEAWEREKAEIEASALAAGGIVEASRHKQGNAAAMREALYMMRRISDEMNGETFGKGDEEIVKGWANTLRYYSDKALSAPPKNCDVGTAEEQAERMFRFCIHHRCCDNCPANGENGHIGCVLRWAAMPYEEGGAQ